MTNFVDDTVNFVQVEPTTKCNFNCTFCCGRYMKQGNLSISTFKKIFSKVPDISHIELQGEGEPFIHPQLFDMVNIAKEKGANSSVITNGSFLSKVNIEKILSSEIETIHCSIESANPKVFQQIRGYNINEIINGLNLLIQERERKNLKYPVIGFCITVLKRTLKTLSEIFNLYQSLGLNGGCFIQPLQNKEFYKNYYDDETYEQILSNNEVKYLDEYCKKDLDFLNIQENCAKVGFYDKLFNKYNDEKDTCPWLEKGFFVTFEGNVMPCCTIKDVKYALGNINKDNAEVIIQRRHNLKMKLQNAVIPEACKGCQLAIQTVRKQRL